VNQRLNAGGKFETEVKGRKKEVEKPFRQPRGYATQLTEQNKGKNDDKRENWTGSHRW